MELIISFLFVAVCDFEHGLCDYAQDGTDDFDWLLASGSVGTGPSIDHTYQTSQGKKIKLIDHS